MLSHATPFHPQDPSITQATTKNANDPILEDYNPFANTNTTPGVGASRSTTQITPTAGPAVLETSRPSVQNGSNSQPPAQTLTQEDLIKKHAELERRAAELAAREEALRTGQVNVRQPNFPPVPSFCPFGPCLYQDINVEIQPEFQRIVRYAYYLWMYFVLVILANFIAGIVRISVQNEYGTFSFALVSLIVLTPISFLFWFRPLYKAFRSDSSFNFMIFFFVFFCQLVLAVLWALGIPFNGPMGLLPAIESMKDGVIYALLNFLVFFMLVSYVLISFWLLFKVHSIYKHTGASFDKAKAEFATGVMSNETVQQSVAGATRSAVSSAISSTLSGGTTSNSGGVRY